MNYKYLNIKSAFAFLLIATISFSCAKQLDSKPTDTIDASKAFQTLDDINLGLIGAYQGLSFSAIKTTSLVTDECMLPSENFTGRNVSTYRWQIDGSNTTITDFFAENYIVIDRINRVLKHIDLVKMKPSDEPALKEQYRGELLALRASCHFELLRYFAEKYESAAMGIPYMEVSEVASPSRLSFGETLVKIKADLAAAKALIPASFNDRSRITKAAVPAIQARVALYEKNWDDAISFSTEAINAIPLAAKDRFAGMWTNDNDDEVIWKFKAVASDDVYAGDIYYDTRKVVLYAPSFELVNHFDQNKDIRFKAYIRSGSAATPYVVNKYWKKNDVQNLSDVRFYRTGEMLLIRSEAYAQKTDLPKAMTDLNALRTARINGYVNETDNNQASVLSKILLERFKELAFEGHRYFDLRRANLSITREPADAINALGAIELKPTDRGYIFPLPNREIGANGNMKQNPGYE